MAGTGSAHRLQILRAYTIRYCRNCLQRDVVGIVFLFVLRACELVPLALAVPAMKSLHQSAFATLQTPIFYLHHFLNELLSPSPAVLQYAPCPAPQMCAGIRSLAVLRLRLLLRFLLAAVDLGKSLRHRAVAMLQRHDNFLTFCHRLVSCCFLNELVPP